MRASGPKTSSLSVGESREDPRKGQEEGASECVVCTTRPTGFEVTPIGASGFGRCDRRALARIGSLAFRRGGKTPGPMVPAPVTSACGSFCVLRSDTPTRARRGAQRSSRHRSTSGLGCASSTGGPSLKPTVSLLVALSSVADRFPLLLRRSSPSSLYSRDRTRAVFRCIACAEAFTPPTPPLQGGRKSAASGLFPPCEGGLGAIPLN